MHRPIALASLLAALLAVTAGCAGSSAEKTAPAPSVGAVETPHAPPAASLENPNRWADFRLLEPAGLSPIMVTALLDREEPQSPVLRVMLSPETQSPIKAATYGVLLRDEEGHPMGSFKRQSVWDKGYEGMILVDEFKTPALVHVHSAVGFLVDTQFVGDFADRFGSGTTMDGLIAAYVDGFIEPSAHTRFAVLVLDNTDLTYPVAGVTVILRAFDAQGRMLTDLTVPVLKPIESWHRRLHLVPIARSEGRALPPATVSVEVLEIMPHLDHSR